MTSQFNAAVEAFQQSMPLLMHGSGDVAPQHVDPATAKLVASLTADYIASLTDAALQVQLLQSPDGVLTAPPPRFRPPKITPSLPPPSNTTTSNTRKRQRPGDEYWDEPLPEPKIKNQTATTDNATPWVGLAGCDLNANGIRSAHVSAANALSTQAFLFPICHDSYAYGRATQMQASKRALVPVLTDDATMELIRTEGVVRKKKKKTQKLEKPKKKKDDEEEEPDNEEDDDEDNESTNSDDEEGGPVWPGLDTLLPSYRRVSEESAALEPNVESFFF